MQGRGRRGVSHLGESFQEAFWGEDAEVSIEFGFRGRWSEAATFTPDAGGMVNESMVIPSGSTQARGYATGSGCSERSVSMPIYSK